MATRDQLVATIRENLNDTGDFYKDIDIQDAIQDGYDEVVALGGTLPKATTISVTANKTYYDLRTLISDFVAVRGIYNARVKRWLIPATLRKFELFRDDWEVQNGEPQYFAVVNYRYAAIYPRVSVTSGDLWVFYYASAPALTGSDSPNLPVTSGDASIEFYATADMFEQAEEWIKAQEYFRQYQEAFAEVLNFRNNLRLPDYVEGLRGSH